MIFCPKFDVNLRLKIKTDDVSPKVLTIRTCIEEINKSASDSNM